VNKSAMIDGALDAGFVVLDLPEQISSCSN
jgi:hypothetical protein